MIDHAAIDAFIRRQHQILTATYDSAWSRGVQSYEPTPRDHTQLTPAHYAVPVGLGLAAGLALARRARPYRAPHTPDARVREGALRPAADSLGKMRDELAAVAPTERDIASARMVIGSGVSTAERVAQVALEQALLGWVESNAYRLNAGESVAWAGEQQGFGEAADADGKTLQWVTEDDDSVCQDCQELGNLDPMPLGDWPTQPGAGGTDCSVGCRCTFEESDELPSAPPDAAVIDRVASSRGEALDAAAPDAEDLALA